MNEFNLIDFWMLLLRLHELEQQLLYADRLSDISAIVNRPTPPEITMQDVTSIVGPSRDVPTKQLEQVMQRFQKSTAGFYESHAQVRAALMNNEETCRDAARTLVSKVEAYCRSMGWLTGATIAKIRDFSVGMTTALMAAEIAHVRETLLMEASVRSYLLVELDRMALLERDDLFGEKVTAAFPTATRDIREAGNCLAAECNTAAVFHLMRAAEVGLRALASDRQISFAKGAPLDARQWGEIIDKLETMIGELRKEDAKQWQSHAVREAQIRFCHDALLQFKSFNEVFRRFVSHVRDDAFYDREQAFRIMTHTGEFMRVLATKLSETSTTPLIWTAKVGNNEQ